MSDPDDFILNGKSLLYEARDDRIHLEGDASNLRILFGPRSEPWLHEILIGAPEGKRLQVGLYENARPYADAQRPQLSLFTGSCDSVGRFDIRDIVAAPGGRVTGLWAVFQLSCGGWVEGVAGEIRIGSSFNTGLVAAPRSLWWRDTYPSDRGPIVPVTLFNNSRSRHRIKDVHVRGFSAPSYRIRLDDCSGSSLLPDQECRVFVFFEPVGRGPKSARLVVTTFDGKQLEVALEGSTVSGRTRVELDSELGDHVGGGASYRYGPLNAKIYARWDGPGVSFAVEGDDGSYWRGVFSPPEGEVLQTRTYLDFGNFDPEPSEAYLSVDGNQRGCEALGEFTVSSLSEIPEQFVVGAFAVSFEQRCTGAKASLRGTMEFRAPTGDTVPPPAPSRLAVYRSAGKVRITWLNPQNEDFAYAIVRHSPSSFAPGLPNSGRFTYAGTGEVASLAGASANRRLAVSVFAVDRAGNVSVPITLIKQVP